MQPAGYCEQYPVLNYSLEILSSSSSDSPVLIATQDQPWNIDIRGNLSENTAYSFRILVSNSVGVVASSTTHFCKLRTLH
jgi:hypothetical protein